MFGFETCFVQFLNKFRNSSGKRQTYFTANQYIRFCGIWIEFIWYMKLFLRENNWWFYFILTYVLSWTVWYLGDLLLPDELRDLVLVIGAFGPFCAAMILVKASSDNGKLKSWLRTTFNLKINYSWYLLGAIALPFLFAGMHHLLYLSLGGESGVNFGADWLLYFVYLIPTALLSGGNEEPGWRGYITPVLLKRFNIWIAHVVVGVGWALWHLPLYMLRDWGGDNQPFIWLVIYCIPLSMIFTWLYYRSRKSILPVMLLHAGSNVVSQYFPMNSRVFENVNDEYTLIKAGLYLFIAIILLISTKGTLGIYREKSEL